MKQRVLILYENTGTGHRRVAHILEDVLTRKSDVEVVCVAGNDFMRSRFGDVILYLWNLFMRLNWILPAELVGTFFTRTVCQPLLEVGYVDTFLDRIAEFDPDVIVSTADAYNKGLATYAKAHGLPLRIFITCPCAFIDTVNPFAAHLCYFEETADAVRDFDFSMSYYADELVAHMPLGRKISYVLAYYWDALRSRGRNIFREVRSHDAPVNDARCISVGPLAEAKHFIPKSRVDIKGTLGIDSDSPCVVVASGSQGGAFVKNAVATLCDRYPGALNVLALCGTDAKAFDYVSGFAGRSGRVKVLPFHYMEAVEDLLAVADCAVVRASAGIFNESMLKKTPIIAYGHMNLGDRPFLRIIESHGLGEVFHSWHALPGAVEAVLHNPASYAKRIDGFLGGYPSSYEAMADLIAAYVLGAPNGNGSSGSRGSASLRQMPQ
ncbi:MAG: hypothetical protein GY851_06155 [bacterium]|nr:hypothetical protein [bacterium]